MSKPLKFDVVILGAGIAGLSVADALSQKRLSCAVIDKQKPGSGASGSPMMLMNPATGRRAKMSYKANEGFACTLNLLNRVQSQTEKIFFETGKLLRPALNKKLAKDFKKSPDKYDWPGSDWIEWLEQDEFSDQYPVFTNHNGGLVISKSATVDGFRFMQSMASHLKKRKVSFFNNARYELKEETSCWSIHIENQETITAKSIVFASGSGVVDSPYWKYLSLHRVKGQTATFYFDDPLPFSYSISSLGYLAYMTSSPRKIVVGSTYEHHFTHLNPDQKGLDLLKKKLGNLFPDLTDQIQKSEMWSAARVTTKDRKPVAGPHPEKRGLYIISGLGSKGLMHGSLTANYLANFIIDGKPIPEEISMNRFRHI